MGEIRYIIIAKQCEVAGKSLLLDGCLKKSFSSVYDLGKRFFGHPSRIVHFPCNLTQFCYNTEMGCIPISCGFGVLNPTSTPGSALTDHTFNKSAGRESFHSPSRTPFGDLLYFRCADQSESVLKKGFAPHAQTTENFVDVDLKGQNYNKSHHPTYKTTRQHNLHHGGQTVKDLRAEALCLQLFRCCIPIHRASRGDKLFADAEKFLCLQK